MRAGYSTKHAGELTIVQSNSTLWRWQKTSGGKDSQGEKERTHRWCWPSDFYALCSLGDTTVDTIYNQTLLPSEPRPLLTSTAEGTVVTRRVGEP